MDKSTNETSTIDIIIAPSAPQLVAGDDIGFAKRILKVNERQKQSPRNRGMHRASDGHYAA